MPRLPQRQSLPTQAADIILEMINAGELANTLPGERTLADRLQIGRDTLRSALDILQAQKIISPRAHGKRRTIIAPGHQTKARPRRSVAFLSPKSVQELPPSMLVEVDTLRELLNNRGFEFEMFNPGIFHLKNPARQLATFVKDRHFDAWILHQCPLPVQQWFQKMNLPTIIRGYSGAGIDIPSIDEDWAASAFHAGGVLTRNGHRSVGLLLPDTKLAGLKAAEAGLRAAVENSQTAGNVHLMIDQVEQVSVHRALERALSMESPPTAIVGTRSRHTLTVMSWLAQHGRGIPKDLSYISLAYDHWYVHLTPAITHYRSYPEAFAKAVTRKAIMLAERTHTRSDKLLMPDYIEGRSVMAH